MTISIQKHSPLAEVGQAKQPLPQAGGWLLEFVEQGRFLHVKFMSLCRPASLLACCMFICFVWPHAMAPTIASDQTKNRRHCLFVVVVLFVSLFVRLFICLLVCLFECLILFSFVSFSVSLLFDARCSNKCQNLDEYFVKNRQAYEFLCVPLKPTTFGVSFLQVIMITNVFTHLKYQI